MTTQDRQATAPRPLILLVDDTPRNLQVLGNILKKQAYHLAVATNGPEALDRVREVKPDLILLDIMMPGLSGYEVCALLQADPAFKDIPVIFLTAKTETEDIVKGFETGAVDYITKPFNGTELLARVKTHLALKQTRDELKSALAAKDRFFSIIAHDLRSPFNTIVSFLKLVDQNADTYSREVIHDLTSELRAKADATLSLLENLLKWAQSQTGMAFQPEHVDLTVLLKETIAVMQSSAAAKSLDLGLDCPDNLNLEGDRNMLATVIRNLISNAIKFTAEGGRVRVVAKAVGGDIEIEVSDTGVGMGEKALEKIFRLDIKMTTEGTAHERGSGLGLILCKEFVEKHGGRIWAASEKGQGSRFTVRLPQQQEDALHG